MYGKRIGYTALALLLGAGFACSQGSSSPTSSDLPAAADAAFAEITESEIVASGFIDVLTEDERARVQAAFERARDALHEIFRLLRAGEIGHEEARIEARGVHDALLAELAEFLDPALVERLRNHRPRPPGRVDLGLDEEQKAEIQAIWDRLHAILGEIGRRLRAGELEAAEARTEAQRAVSRAHDAVCAVLDETQAAAVPFCAG